MSLTGKDLDLIPGTLGDAVQGWGLPNVFLRRKKRTETCHGMIFQPLDRKCPGADVQGLRENAAARQRNWRKGGRVSKIHRTSARQFR